MKAIRQGLAALLLLGICLVPASFRSGSTEEEAGRPGVSRCLVIGYDRFVTMPDTAPCSANNTEVMASLLADFAPEPEIIVRRVNEPGTVEGLERLIRETFADAGPQDTGYLYISTHGVTWEEDGQPRMALILSDGTGEEALDPARLKAMLDEVPGRFVLILDACHSGAAAEVFTGSKYRLLAASGPGEESYFWRAGSEDGAGTGYFTSALESALRASRPEQIDRDGNGELSFTETLERLAAIYGASTPVGAAADGAGMLFRFPEDRKVRERILGLEFDPLLREEGTLILPFRFSVPEATRIEYRLVTRKEGRWDFDHGTTLPDRERTGTARGLLAPGDKERKIRLSAESLGEEGMAVLQVISLRGLHSQVPVLEGTWVILGAEENESRNNGPDGE